MTAEQLEQLLGKVTQGEWDKFEGEDEFWFIEAERGMIGESVAGDALEYDATLIALAPYIARRVICAEKLVAELEQILENDDDHWSMFKCALTAYREASQ